MILNTETQNRVDKTSEATFCIIIGTLVGLLSYWLFLFLNIAIFGWNLGLIVAPMLAGYVETYLANKYMGETTGAVSAFILFAVTVAYSFIINNPTLGINVITFGAAFIIIQSAMPTLINYFIIITSLSIISYVSGIFKRITDYFYDHGILKLIYKKEKYVNRNIEEAINYDDKLKIDINDLGILISSATHIEDSKIIEFEGVYEGKVIYEAENSMGFEKNTEKLLKDLVNAKKQAILDLSENVKKDNCNAVLNLELRYEVVDKTGKICIVTAYGTGVKYI